MRIAPAYIGHRSIFRDDMVRLVSIISALLSSTVIGVAIQQNSFGIRDYDWSFPTFEPASIPPDVAETKLAAIRRRTIIVETSFDAPLPSPGSRVAIGVVAPDNTFLPIAAEAWVEDSPPERPAVLCHPRDAVLVKLFSKSMLLTASFIPDGVDSPYQGRVFTDVAAVKRELANRSPIVDATERNTPPATTGDVTSNSVSTVWVPSEQSMFVIDATGGVSLKSPKTDSYAGS